MFKALIYHRVRLLSNLGSRWPNSVNCCKPVPSILRRCELLTWKIIRKRVLLNVKFLHSTHKRSIVPTKNLKFIKWSIKLQWKPLNVITDNVIIRLMLSEWPGPKPLSMKNYIKNLDIVITLRILLSVWSQKLWFLCQTHINFDIFHIKAIISIFNLTCLTYLTYNLTFLK